MSCKQASSRPTELDSRPRRSIRISIFMGLSRLCATAPRATLFPSAHSSHTRHQTLSHNTHARFYTYKEKQQHRDYFSVDRLLFLYFSSQDYNCILNQSQSVSVWLCAEWDTIRFFAHKSLHDAFSHQASEKFHAFPRHSRRQNQKRRPRSILLSLRPPNHYFLLPYVYALA